MKGYDTFLVTNGTLFRSPSFCKDGLCVNIDHPTAPFIIHPPNMSLFSGLCAISLSTFGTSLDFHLIVFYRHLCSFRSFCIANTVSFAFLIVLLRLLHYFGPPSRTCLHSHRMQRTIHAPSCPASTTGQFANCRSDGRYPTTSLRRGALSHAQLTSITSALHAEALNAEFSDLHGTATEMRVASVEVVISRDSLR